MKRLKRNLHFIFVFLLATACRVSDTSSEATQVVKVEDRYEMTLPNSLTSQNNLYEEASLQYGNGKSELFVVLYQVLKDSLHIKNKKAFVKSFGLKDYFSICKKGWAEAKMMRPTDKQITETTINKYPAVVVETTETVNGIGVFYVVAIVETKKTYYQVFTWTLASKKEKNYQQMKDIINSLKEL